jgi:hypothetical protein
MPKSRPGDNDNIGSLIMAWSALGAVGRYPVAQYVAGRAPTVSGSRSFG